MSEETPPASGVSTICWLVLTIPIRRKEWASSQSCPVDLEPGGGELTDVIGGKAFAGTLFACYICPIIAAPSPNALMRLGDGPDTTGQTHRKGRLFVIRYGFNIKTKHGQRVENILIMAATLDDAERRLRQMYHHCEIVECREHAGPAARRHARHRSA